MKYSPEDIELERILGENHNIAAYYNNDILQEGIKRYTYASEKSQHRSKIRNTTSKKKSNKNLRIRLMALVLAGVTLTGAYVAKKNTGKFENPITSISNIAKRSDEIDDKILNYQTLMNIGAEFAIESSSSRDKNNEPLVFYDSKNINNLTNMIENASKISEEETRCVILAAYKIINAQYRDKVIGEALDQLDTTSKEDTVFKVPKTTKGLLELLGYENWEEYNNNERNNIKDLKEIGVIMEGRAK